MRKHNARLTTVKKEDLAARHRQCVKPDQVGTVQAAHLAPVLGLFCLSSSRSMSKNHRSILALSFKSHCVRDGTRGPSRQRACPSRVLVPS